MIFGSASRRSLRRPSAAGFGSQVRDAWDIACATTKSKGCDIISVTVAKATRHDDSAPKEKHVLILVRSASRPGPDLAYTAHRLCKRLRTCQDWRPVLKTLYCIHALSRRASPHFSSVVAADADGVFALAHMSTVVGHAVPAMPFVRAYAAFVEAKLEHFMASPVDYESHFSQGGRGGGAGDGAPEDRAMNPYGALSASQVIDALGRLQRLMGAAVACMPSREVFGSPAVVASLSAVIRESFIIQACLMQATLHLVDTFPCMDVEDAERALFLYEARGGELRERQQRFYAIARDVVGEDHGQPELTDVPDTLASAMKHRIACLHAGETQGVSSPQGPRPPRPKEVDYEVVALGVALPSSPEDSPVQGEVAVG